MPPFLLSMLRRSLPTALLLFGASALLLLTDRASSARSLPAVAVLQQTSSKVLEDAVQGMLAGLAERGWIDGKTLKIQRYNAEGDISQANAIAREIVGGPFDMVFTSSTPSLQAVATANARGKLKHIFVAVADPFSAGVGLERSNPLIHPPHLVGFGSLSPVHATFLIARRILPNLRRVGVAHCPAESNSRRYMELARASCKKLGIEVLEAPVENSSGVVEAIQSTIGRGAEAIFCPGDTIVVSAIDSIINTATKAGLPVFTVNPGVAERGTLLDLGFNFEEVGLVAGRLAADILEGADTTAMPIRETAHEIPPYLLINRVVAARGNWHIPDDLLEQARIVVETTGRRDYPDHVLAGPFEEPDGP